MPKPLTLIAGLIILVASFLAMPFILSSCSKQELPIYGTSIEFSMTGTDGKPFGTNDLKGKLWVANFIFTSCPSQCPRMTEAMAKLYRSYALDDKVHFVSFTVDPDRDTPAVLKAYADGHKINTTKWSFLTAPVAVLTKVSVEGLKVGTSENPLFHNDRFVLIDDKLRIRGYYDALDPEVLSKLFDDIATLLKVSQS
jgi:protein SCO1/2